MNINGIKKIIMAMAVIFAFAITMSSCNRGIGCPSDFSIDQVVTPVIKVLAGVE